MRKEVFLIFLLMFIPLATSIDLETSSELGKGETFFAKFSGNFVEGVDINNINFYQRHIKISPQKELFRVDDEYYLYAILPTFSDNYSMRIEDTKYYKGSEVVEEDIVSNFSIQEDFAQFSLNKGFVTTNQNFSLIIQNLQESKIEVSFSDETNLIDSPENLDLKSGETREIEFYVNEITESTLQTITLSSGDLTYNVPIYLIENQTSESNEDFDLRFSPSSLEVIIGLSSEDYRPFYLENSGDNELENISLYISDSLKPYVSLSLDQEDSIDSLKVNSKIRLEAYFYSYEDEGQVDGFIRAQANNTENIYLPISIEFISGYEPLDEGEEVTIPPRPNITQNTECSTDNDCREGTCSNSGVCIIDEVNGTGSSTSGRIIGVAILILLVIFIYWFWKNKYRKARKEVDLFKKK